MKAEAYLDYLIDQSISGEKSLFPIDNTIAPMLAAAEMLVQLQKITSPPEFTRRLEGSLRARIHNRGTRSSCNR